MKNSNKCGFRKVDYRANNLSYKCLHSEPTNNDQFILIYFCTSITIEREAKHDYYTYWKHNLSNHPNERQPEPHIDELGMYIWIEEYEAEFVHYIADSISAVVQKPTVKGDIVEASCLDVIVASPLS